MKHKNLILTCVFFATTLITHAQNVKLSGKITNPTGDKVYLYSAKFENNEYIISYLDSTNLNNDGTFVLKTNVDKTTEVTFSDGNEYMMMLISPNDDLFMTLNTKYFDETITFSGVGSEKNNAIISLYLIEEAAQNNIFSNVDSKNLDTILLFNQYEKHSEQFLSLISDYNSSIPEFKVYGENRVKEYEENTANMKAHFRSLIQFNNFVKTLVNKPATDFEGIDLNGEKTKISDYKGKITIVDFWATWCGPCRAEFPAYKQLEEKYGKDVNFVSVALWCDEDPWKKMATDEGFTHNIYLSKEADKQLEQYKVGAIPRYIVIDENFNIIDADAPRPSSGELEKYWVR